MQQITPGKLSPLPERWTRPAIISPYGLAHVQDIRVDVTRALRRRLEYADERHMGKDMSTAFVMTILLSAAAQAQWLNYPTPGVPRGPDGKPNPSAPPPKTADGKPDLSGTWTTRAGYTGNIAKDLKPGEVSFQPWAEELYKHRQ